jgi:zinc finger HIT domain-containing protein 1
VPYHRGVYGKYEDATSDPDAAVFHVCPASWFHGQLPVGFGREGYVSEDFHHLGGVEAFASLEALLAHANANLAEQPGYFYVVQIDGKRLREGAREDAETFPGDDAEKKRRVPDDGSSVEDLGSDRVVVRAPLDVDVIQRVFVAAREEENMRRGKFTDVSPPT